MLSITEFVRTQYKAIVPEVLKEGVLVRRRSALFINAGIVFIHVPKAAGSSVNQALYGQFMGHITAQSLERFGNGHVCALPRFALTRNPWDRLVSAWRFVRAGSGQGEGVTAGIYKPQQYAEHSFLAFDRFVEEWLPARKLDALDGVFRLQSDYVLSSAGKRLVDHLGRVEAMKETEAWLSQTLGRAIAFPHSNRSGEGVDYRSFYTPALRDRVGEIYAADVTAFGYDF